MKKEMPSELPFSSVLFGDGARGMRMQVYANEEFRVTRTAMKENRDAEFVVTYMSELTEDEEFDSFAALRTRYNELIKK